MSDVVVVGGWKEDGVARPLFWIFSHFSVVTTPSPSAELKVLICEKKKKNNLTFSVGAVRQRLTWC